MENWLRNPRVQGTGDALLAAILAVTSVVPVLAFGDPSWGKPKALGVTLGLLSTVPIAWRSRYPLSVAAIVLAANAACIFVAAPNQAAFQPFVALVLTFYSAGSRAEGRRAIWVPPVLAVASVPIFFAAVRHGQSSGNIIPSIVWLLAAWVVGRTVRSWRHKNVALEAANRELEEQRELQAQAAVAVERRADRARAARRGGARRERHGRVQAGRGPGAVRPRPAGRPRRRAGGDRGAPAGEALAEMRTLLGVLLRARRARWSRLPAARAWPSSRSSSAGLAASRARRSR